MPPAENETPPMSAKKQRTGAAADPLLVLLYWTITSLLPRAESVFSCMYIESSHLLPCE